MDGRVGGVPFSIVKMLLLRWKFLYVWVLSWNEEMTFLDSVIKKKKVLQDLLVTIMVWTVLGLWMTFFSFFLSRRYLCGGPVHHVLFLTMLFTIVALLMARLSPRVGKIDFDRFVELLIDQMRREHGQKHESTVANASSDLDESDGHHDPLERTKRRSTRRGRSTHGLDYHAHSNRKTVPSENGK